MCFRQVLAKESFDVHVLLCVSGACGKCTCLFVLQIIKFWQEISTRVSREHMSATLLQVNMGALGVYGMVYTTYFVRHYAPAIIVSTAGLLRTSE